jgi:pimeloyl-ACP methyl ester carboxylesterase
MTEPSRRTVLANGVTLNVYAAGTTNAATPIVMLHGMRDVGLSLMPIAEPLARQHPVFIMDLRGHGESDKPGNYALSQLVFDLHRVVSEVADGPVILFGHSLGGHVVCRFAAMFPDLAAAAIVVEGLGPPAAGRDQRDLRAEGQRLLGTLSIPAEQRPLPSVEFAAERLQHNNPRLQPDRALELARQGTTRNAAGDLVWAFDPRVGSVFLGEGDSAGYWSGVQCPTCLVAGALSAEYWGRAVPAGAGWDGSFAPGEMEARAATFPDAELVTFDKSGHMVHFDEPERLAEVTLDFLRRRL